jgi:hypothetical protein
VTCGGEFDATAGHYRSNIIVFAALRRDRPGRAHGIRRSQRSTTAR